MTNAIVVWNALYMQEVLRQMQGVGRDTPDELLRHFSPARFDDERESAWTRLRPLRKM